MGEPLRKIRKFRLFPPQIQSSGNQIRTRYHRRENPYSRQLGYRDDQWTLEIQFCVLKKSPIIPILGRINFLTITTTFKDPFKYCPPIYTYTLPNVSLLCILKILKALLPCPILAITPAYLNLIASTTLTIINSTS